MREQESLSQSAGVTLNLRVRTPDDADSCGGLREHPVVARYRPICVFIIVPSNRGQSRFHSNDPPPLP